MIQARIADHAPPGESLGFAVVEATAVVLPALADRARLLADGVREDLRSDSSSAMATAAEYGRFFQSNGFRSPLEAQLQKAASKGFPQAPPAVLFLLVAEAATGVLMGVQNAPAIAGDLEMSRVGEEEAFEGMRGPIRCSEGDLVVRDNEAIIASLFQGPDKRTATRPDSDHLAYLVFGCPGRPELVDQGCELLVETLRSCSDNVSVSKAGDLYDAE